MVNRKYGDEQVEQIEQEIQELTPE